MEQVIPHSKINSWLSLVAETAGVSGATIMRLKIEANTRGSGCTRAVVQVRDSVGKVLGATYWYGRSEQLLDGVTVDLGCDLETHVGTEVVGWIESGGAAIDPRGAQAPQKLARTFFHPTRAMKLMLLGEEPIVAEAA